MKRLLIGLSVFALSFSSFAEKEKSKLDSKLDSLNIPSDKVTPLVSEDKLYSVNARYSSLVNRHELTMFGANNFTADSHLETTQSGVTYRYHLNSDWSFGARYTEYFNKLSGAGEKLFDSKSILPDSDYAIKSTDAFVNYNTVYGKLRLTKETIVYFDQYIALGYGTVGLARDEAQMYILDAGFSFWIGKHMSARVGLKNEFYTQQKLNGDENTHNGMGYLEFGYLFGEGRHL